MADIEVKRYTYYTSDYTLTYLDVTIDAVDPAKAFSRPLAFGLGAATYVGGNDYVSGRTSCPIVTGSTTVRVYLDDTPSGDRTGAFEVWEYVGGAGGPNEFVVLHHDREEFTATADIAGRTQTVTLDNTATDLDRCVAIWSGYTASGLSPTEKYAGDRYNIRMEVTDVDEVTLNRYDWLSTTEVGVTVVEFTGSAWTVNKLTDNHPVSTPADATLPLGFSVADWSKAMLFFTFENANGSQRLDNSTFMVFVGDADVDEIKSFWGVDVAYDGPEFTAYVVEHADLIVEHNDSTDGTLPTPPETSPVFVTINEPDDWETTTSVGIAGASDFAGWVLNVGSWATSLIDSTTLGAFYEADPSATSVEWAIQIIDLGAIIAPDRPDYTIDNYQQPAEQAPIIEWDTTIDLTYQGDIVASSSDSLVVIAGAVHQSNRRAYRSNLRGVRIVDPDNNPDIGWLLSHRSGAELVPTIRWTVNGVTRTEQLGVFRPHRTKPTETVDGLQYELAGWDRAWQIDRAGIVDTPIRIADDTDAAAAIAQIIDTVYAGTIEYLSGSAGVTVARTTWRPGDDPWSDAVLTNAQAAGVDVWFDRQGRLNIQQITTPTTADWELTDQALEVSTVDDSAGWGNGVNMISTAPWLLFGISTTVWDDDPNSPTYYLGPTGKHLITVENPAVFSQAAAETAARAELERLRGSDADLEWSQIPDPRIEPGQIVDVNRPNLGISDRYRVDEVTIPFTPGPVRCVARQIGAS